MLLLIACSPSSSEPVRTISPPREAPMLEEPVSEAAPSRTVPTPFETKRIGASASNQGPHWQGRPIDLDVKEADLHDVFRLLSDVGHANIVVGDDVSGRVTIRMKHVPWDQALDVVARAKGLAVEHDGNVLFITRPNP